MLPQFIQVRWRTSLTWPRDLVPTTDQHGPFLHTTLAILHQLLQVGLVVLRAMVGVSVQGVADFHLPHFLHLQKVLGSGPAQCHSQSWDSSHLCGLYRPQVLEERVEAISQLRGLSQSDSKPIYYRSLSDRQRDIEQREESKAQVYLPLLSFSSASTNPLGVAPSGKPSPPTPLLSPSK